MLELIVRGGWALWIILGCSVVALGVALERFLTLRQADVDSEALLADVTAAVDRGDVAGAMAKCEAAPGPVAETLAIGLRNLMFLESCGKRPEEIEAGIVRAMEDHTGHVVDYLETNLNALATISSLAPILGMMGTVVGMIRAFVASAAENTMTPATVSKGIGEALLCTAGGLIVAAVTTVEYNYFVGRVNKFVLKVQLAGTALVERVLHSHARRARGLGPVTAPLPLAGEAVPA